MGGPLFWTLYRRFYVREGLADGVKVSALAARLGASPQSVNVAIRRWNLRDPTACLACGASQAERRCGCKGGRLGVAYA